jgi:hypothetical protein
MVNQKKDAARESAGGSSKQAHLALGPGAILRLSSRSPRSPSIASPAPPSVEVDGWKEEDNGSPGDSVRFDFWRLLQNLTRSPVVRSVF